jgi:acyl-CoA thioester hydrolase
MSIGNGAVSNGAGSAAALGREDTIAQVAADSAIGDTLAAETVVGETRLRVRYAETDQMGVVYHANYLVWFEVGRAELMRQRGLVYKRIEVEEERAFAVVEATVRYKAPARYDDELVVETRVLRVRGPVVRFGYRIVRVEDGLLLCEGETVHVMVGRDMKRRSMPRKYAEILGAAASDTQP